MAWARNELAKALLPPWSSACAAGLTTVLALAPDGNTLAPLDESWLRTSADPKACLCFGGNKAERLRCG